MAAAASAGSAASMTWLPGTAPRTARAQAADSSLGGGSMSIVNDMSDQVLLAVRVFSAVAGRPAPLAYCWAVFAADSSWLLMIVE